MELRLAALCGEIFDLREGIVQLKVKNRKHY